VFSPQSGALVLIVVARTLTTWLIPETFDWRIVTASPIDGFLVAIALVESEVSYWN